MRQIFLQPITIIGRMLDDMHVAMCLFDEDDRTLHWNKTFLVIFPEHAGKVHEGEHYRDNLRRFYNIRLAGDELAMIDQYIEAGINRHHQQNQAFVFIHRFQSITASSMAIPHLGRLRMWRSARQIERVSSERTSDVSEINEERLRDFDRFLDKVPDGLMVCDQEGRIKWVNKTFADMYGLPGKDIANHTSFDFVYKAAWALHGRNEDQNSYNAGLAIIRDNFRFCGAPFELALPNDCYVRIVGNATDDNELFYTHVDITQTKRQAALLKKAEREARSHIEQINFLMRQDVLTGVANRLAADEQLTRHFAAMKANGPRYALMVLDIDHFKAINDAHGHQIGDEVLKDTASAISASLREMDFAARTGGEEFVVIVQMDEPAQLKHLAERMRMAIENQRHPIAGNVTISIGIAIADPCDSSEMDAVKAADKCLYEAKSRGRNCVVLSTDSLPRLEKKCIL